MVQERPVQARFRRSDSTNPIPLTEPSTAVSVVTGSRFTKSWQPAPETKQIPTAVGRDIHGTGQYADPDGGIRVRRTTPT